MAVFLLLTILATPFIWIRFQITNPFGFLFVFFGIFFVSKYFHHIYTNSSFLEDISPGLINGNLYAISLFLFLSYLIFYFLINIKNNKIYINNNFKLNKIFYIFVVLIPLILFSIGIFKGINPLNNPLGFRQLIQSNGFFYLLSIELYLINVLSIYIIYQWFKNRKMPDALLLITYVYSFVFSIYSGFSSMAITFFVAPLFFYNLCFGKRIEKYFLYVFPFVAIYVMIYSAYRDANLNDSNISLYQSLIKVLERDDLLLTIYNRFDYLEMYTKGQIFISSGNVEPFYSLINFLYSPIPRFFYPDKPLNFSQIFTVNLLPQNFEIGVTANYGALNEFSYNFGQFFGMAVGSIFLGYFLTICYRYFLRSKNNPYMSIFYLSVIFPYLQAGIVSGFIHDLALPMLILNFIYFNIFIGKTALEKN